MVLELVCPLVLPVGLADYRSPLEARGEEQRLEPRLGGQEHLLLVLGEVEVGEVEVQGELVLGSLRASD
eukprot:13299066-Heterocapsa_arctica.AAC.1